MTRRSVVRGMLLSVALTAPARAATETGIMGNARVAEAAELMWRFAERSGLTAPRSPRRYLWTDAFAVCNFLALAQATHDERYAPLALELIRQVHDTLGRHRADDERSGWISGLDEREGAAHPTRGGLRIGKRLPERAAGEPLDERLEWERDGQYYHYLTRWMHALDQAARRTREPRLNAWARELAAAAFDAFTRVAAPGRRRMVWKMSIDLTRALVPAMGQHDPLDGYITHLELTATAATLASTEGPRLEEQTRALEAMIEAQAWASADPLAIGGLLVDTYRVAQLPVATSESGARLIARLLESARAGLDHYAASGELRAPAAHRLAFRELGLSIGLHALERMQREASNAALMGPDVRAAIAALARHLPLVHTIETLWRDPANRRSPAWGEHRDINEVMLATSLVPDGYLVLRAPR